ncbi:MAG: ATP-binding cassette domain-containing protein [Victivallales bacterium]|nr:ATP-binding cassette domain-containing protein [Victivallales bacterium]
MGKLKLTNISKKLGVFKLEDISFSLETGDYFVILGKSGSGKSVLLEIISGLITPDKGRVYLNEKDITAKKIQKRNLGLVFQNHSLFPHLSVKSNILYPLRARKKMNADTGKKLETLCRTLGILNLLNLKPGTLSLGESQRVALARTLITSPECILLDEPLSSLDIQTKAEIKTLLRKINKDSDSVKSEPQTVLHVTHDYEEAISLANKIGVIENGSISQIGTPEEVFRHPGTEFVANFAGIKNFFRGKAAETENGISVFTPYMNNIPANISFYISGNYRNEEDGNLIIKGENITIANELYATSARNTFKGKITDIENVKSGIEVTVKTNGLLLSSLITKESLNNLNLSFDKTVYISFKANAAKFIK